MSTPSAPSSPTPAGDDRHFQPVDEKNVTPSFEDRLRLFLEKNSKAIIAVVVIVFVGIIAKGTWEYLAAQKELGIEQAYAAATTPVQLKAFIEANPSHPLAGAAHLKTADDAYAERRFADAITPYEQAAAVMKTGPFAARARLGLAMSKLQGGRVADGEAALKALAADANEIKPYRAEAAYHLTSQAVTQGNVADVTTYSDLLMQIDPASPWTQRALQLRASMPNATAPAPAATDAAPAITLPAR